MYIQMSGCRDGYKIVTSFRTPSLKEPWNMARWIPESRRLNRWKVCWHLWHVVSQQCTERGSFRRTGFQNKRPPHWLTGAEAAFPPFVWWEVCVRALYSHVIHGSNSRGSEGFNYTSANQRKHHTCGSWHVLLPSHRFPSVAVSSSADHLYTNWCMSEMKTSRHTPLPPLKRCFTNQTC